MTLVKYVVVDYAQGQLLSSITSGATSITLKSGHGSEFPSTYPYILVFEKIAGGVVTQYEQVKVTNRSGDVLTVQRGQNGTTAQAFAGDDYVSMHMTALVVTDMQDAIQALETGKLTAAGGLRTALSSWRTYYTDGSGNETALAIGASGTVLTSNGASSAPSWQTPTVDITGLTNDDALGASDKLIYYQNGVGNKKRTAKASATVAGLVEMLTDAEATTGTDEERYLNAKQAKDNYGYVIGAGTEFTAGTADSSSTSLSTTYVKVKQMTINRTGTYTVDFDLRLNVSFAYTAYGRIYKNGVAHGSEQTETTNTYVTKTENLAFTAGDTIELRVKTSDAARAVGYRNMRVKYTFKPYNADATVTLDT